MRQNLLFLTLLFSVFCISQQVSIDNTLSPQSLIENNLIQGCVEVSNITSQDNGSVDGIGSFGYFERSNSNFPFENGIVLSTGNVNSGGNGQDNSTLNEGSENWGNDSDLESVLGINNTLNATSIEFDFISSSNQIQFNYILASEEYTSNFPCNYSDGFAFLIKEVSGGAYENIALIPNTNIPVNTNTIHDEIVGFCGAENASYFQGYNVGDTNYNGRTKVLTAAATIQPNVQYHIKLVIADQTDENYDSAVFIQGNSFNSTIDLGDDFSTCADSQVLNADINDSQSSYVWYLNGSVINNANQPTLNITQSGNYRVQITSPFAGSTCTIEDDINVNLSSTQDSDPMTDYRLCDDMSGDGIESFDLSIKDNEALASVIASNYNVTYHLTSNDMQNATNAISGALQNTQNPQTIYVRIEDVNSGCLAYNNFNLIVNSLPVINTPTVLQICGGETGYAIADLSSKDAEITNGNNNLFVTYHDNMAHAESGYNPLPTNHPVNSEAQVYVRVRDVNTNCVSVTTLNIIVTSNPVLEIETIYLDGCDADRDGYTNFDLTTVIPEVLDVFEGLTGITITFHETAQDAELDQNHIANASNYTNIQPEEQVIYIRAEMGNSGCANIIAIEIHTNLLLTRTDVGEVLFCDNDNDGSEVINFAILESQIANGLPDVNVAFYNSQEDLDNQENPISLTQVLTLTEVPQTFYIGVSSLTCYETALATASILPVETFDPIGNQTVCDTDDDGFTNIDLALFNDTLTDNRSDVFYVTYFLSEEDAINDENQLPNNYVNTTNPFTVYSRISEAGINCYDISSFQITVLEAPSTNSMQDLSICDDNNDGTEVLNLDTFIPQVTNSNNVSISFYNDLTNANNAINQIDNTSAYNTSSSLIHIRVENNNTGCFAVETFYVNINTRPEIQNISNYNICEDNSDNVGDFIFNTKDSEIVNGQSEMQTLYYTNQEDANNRVNTIDKNTAYQNTSNPQTIYVRLENIDNENCYITSNFSIEVGSNPNYNTPTDLSICDDSSNNASETFDLSSVSNEMLDGINEDSNITFHNSQSEALNGTNALPLQYQNTVNPQQIYARVDNGGICTSITSFTLNVIQIAEVNPIQPITQCDDDTDGFAQFNLAEFAEDAIVDIRQENLEVAYFPSYEDVEAHTNQITNPDNYTNISNPQTAYLKVTNIISNCYIAVPIELVVNLAPAINDFGSYGVCDNDTNSFDLSTIDSIITENSFNIVVSYYATENDANTNTNALNNNYIYSSYSDIIYARVEYSTTHCFAIYPFSLRINQSPIANTPADITECDNDYDGIFTFNLSQQTSSILGGQNPSNYMVTYHENIGDATQGSNEVSESGFLATDGTTVFARITNNSTQCFDITSFSLMINRKPYVDIENQIVCLENLPLVVSAETGFTNDTYSWSTNETSSEIEITEVGTYTVTVTSDLGCVTTETFMVTESEAANIEIVEVVDFSDPNHITITVSGIGDYLYQLDDGPLQESNYFGDVSIGYHMVTVYDANGCSHVSKEVLVIDYPKHMTPNNDGSFDTWHIAGVETLPGTVVHVFDRYGKLLKTMNHSSNGWDGTFKGTNMPNDDYWFLAEVKRNDEAFEVRGHFALRR